MVYIAFDYTLKGILEKDTLKFIKFVKPKGFCNAPKKTFVSTIKEASENKRFSNIDLEKLKITIKNLRDVYIEEGVKIVIDIDLKNLVFDLKEQIRQLKYEIKGKNQ